MNEEILAGKTDKLDLDLEHKQLIQDYKTRYPELVEVINESIASSFSQIEIKPISINVVVN